MSNFPLLYRLSWLPRFLRPSLRGARDGFAAPAGVLTPRKPRETVRLVFVGDISAVSNRTAPYCDPALADIIASADLVVGNCESPVVRRPRASLRTALGTHHAMDAGFVLGVVEAIGVEPARLALSLANNHALDQGAAGFRETVETLRHLGIMTFGIHGRPLPEPIRLGNLTVGLLAFSEWRNAGRRQFAGRINMTADIAAWPPPDAAHCDLVCATPHWDWEFRHFPRAATRRLAASLAERGVGLIAGHHAHVVQPVERLGSTVVAYGLGDFLGTGWSRQPWAERIGAMLVAEVSADPATRGQVAAYGVVPFLRLRERDHERLLPVEALDGELGRRVKARVARVFGPAA